MYEGNLGEINSMVQVSVRFELANLRFGLSGVDCMMKEIRRSSTLGLGPDNLRVSEPCEGCEPCEACEPSENINF